MEGGHLSVLFLPQKQSQKPLASICVSVIDHNWVPWLPLHRVIAGKVNILWFCGEGVSIADVGKGVGSAQHQCCPSGDSAFFLYSGTCCLHHGPLRPWDLRLCGNEMYPLIITVLWVYVFTLLLIRVGMHSKCPCWTTTKHQRLIIVQCTNKVLFNAGELDWCPLFPVHHEHTGELII